ncbi:hypothetical protein Pint_03854 [Pistacia integerrima]|uniref:Uncharacterized protein n=1 Tax=Pistacia integerrima TaxID=434235 RepID=A0ACC0Z684_9ROSI|nr:hypothetical protein Pint_03854 [Pistacia integerrima]
MMMTTWTSHVSLLYKEPNSFHYSNEVLSRYVSHFLFIFLFSVISLEKNMIRVLPTLKWRRYTVSLPLQLSVS